jgi:hypothetical protein
LRSSDVNLAGKAVSKSNDGEGEIMVKKVMAVLAVISALTACTPDKEAFNKSWRESFIKSCVGKDETKREICTCVADKAVAEMEMKELLNPTASIKHITEKILPECQKPAE